MSISDERTRIDSFMEAATNTGIGFFLSLVVTVMVFRAYGLPTSLGQNAAITGIFTAVSVLRSYALRRIFNGRSVWAAIRGSFS